MAPTFKQPLLDVYVELANFIVCSNSLLEEDAANLIRTIKRITHMNGKELPLPSRSVVDAHICIYMSISYI